MDSDFNYTQNIIIRSDLKISKGKLCAQVAHAAVSASETARNTHNEWWINWLNEGQRKVVLKAASLEDLGKLKAEADKLSLPVALIEDRGLTEVPPGTVTCLGIGPAPTNMVNRITGKLQLL